MKEASSHSPRNLGRWPLVGLTIGALLCAGVMLVMYAHAALTWQQHPFLGFLPLRSLEVSPNDSLVGDAWPALAFDLRPGDRLTGIDDVNLDALPLGKRAARLNDVLSRHKAGDIVPIRLLRTTTVPNDFPRTAMCALVPGTSDLRNCNMRLRLITMSTGDLLGYFGAGWLTGVVLWLVAAALFLRQPHNTIIRTITLLSALLVIFMAGRFDTVSTHRAVWVWLLATCLTGGLMVVFGLEFPFRFAMAQRNPLWLAAPLIVALALGGASIGLYYSQESYLNQAAFAVAIGTLIVGALLTVGMMVWRRTRSASPVARNQSTMILIGLVPVLLPILGWFFITLIGGEGLTHLAIFNQVLPILLPLSAMYAALQYRLLDADRIITQSTLYGGLLVILTVAYWLLAAVVAVLIGRAISQTALDPFLLIVGIFLVAILFTPLRARLQHMIDRVYFRTRHAYQLYLEQFARDITNAVNLTDLVRLVQRALGETLGPTHLMMFVRDPVLYDYVPCPDPVSGLRPTDIIFAPESGLANYLRERDNLLYLQEGRPLPLDVVSDRARLAVLKAPVIVGLRGQRALNGFLVIGPRQGGAPYLHEDLRFIQSLSDQVALAVERAQAVEDLERRVRVQDVLSQVSRALNFAIDFDVLLELIYAQTMRVINVPNFYIALRNPNTDELQYVFYNEGDERIETMEGKRWRMGRDLMSEIARSRQTIRTEDFLRETLQRDPTAHPDNPNLKAWMGVPLLADTGEGVLGVMVAATTEQGSVFNDEQQDLFWDIANLASSAIDKLQLFEKTQQRARQLAVINEISSQLSSEMGNVDRLLRLITEHAVQILNTEAGSLLLVDEETGDLVFHVVVGGREDLIGTRIPAGSGLAGVTVERGTPVIVNDPARDSRWYGDIRSGAERSLIGDNGREGDLDGDLDDPALNQDVGLFRTNAILTVPLLAQGGRAIGVLQVINKRDGSIFIPEDADLLQTFAGQAAIAIENARLFNMTDQQLALRVQELDTMQRIDQELNRTLNLKNVVDITMDWAMRKSGATAGGLFILDPDREDLDVVASYGYPPESPLYKVDGQTLSYPPDVGVVARAIRTQQSSLIKDVSIDPDYLETLPGCVEQLVVPLTSANRVIGVIILESTQEGQLDLLDLDFVARLAEHATPAIVNAQLFQELDRANQDKSKFVSFVAHELRNPMTSMKGYTDLLLKGVVGPVNEQQSSFLTTIFNNVNRMETLVSDLNDLTKQETGNLRLELSPINFRNVVVETLRAQQRQIEDKDQELVIEVPEDLPPVMGDQTRLIQIMTNFVSNAYKYTPPGGTIRITAEAARNIWDPQGAPQVIHCAVQDTGIGMSEDDLKELFKAYFRSENTKAREQPGTGLGLTITRGLILQHGGTVWVESKLDQGTTFHFTLPVATEEETQQARARAQTRAPARTRV